MGTPEKAAGCGCVVWLLAVLANIAFWAAVIYIALHFVKKFW
jgi:hypothetical protein